MSNASTVTAERMPHDRDAQILAVIAAVIERRWQGATSDDDSVMREFPELMPELGDRLRALRIVEAARDNGSPVGEGDKTLTLRSDHAAPDSPPSLPPVDLLAGYTIVREISRGGQGVVYEALQEGTKRRVALKVLHPVFSESGSARRRFEREVELVASLRHPNIVSIFHVARTSDGRDGYVMDFVEGVTLKAFARSAHLRLPDALRLFAGICDAVQFAHQNGIIHRDLKPSNILVDERGEPRLLDFGLARPVDATGPSNVTLSDEIVGTLPYMSPEQTRGGVEPLDTRSDVYSLGVMLYELLSGRYPYDVGSPLLSALRNIAEAIPKPLSQAWSADAGVLPKTRSRRTGARSGSESVRPTRSESASVGTPAEAPSQDESSRSCPIDDEVETIVRKALNKERDRRYQSAGELGRDVRRYLAGEAIEAKRDRFAYVLRKLIRRNAGSIVIAAAVFGILISFCAYAGIAYLNSQVDRLAKQRLDAALQRESRHYLKLEATARQWQLGWFLLEWRADRADLARHIADLYFAPMAHERPVVEFLLDSKMTFEELRSQLPGEYAAVAYLAAGERALKYGDRSAAIEHFRAGVAEANPQSWWSAVLRDRIRQSENTAAASTETEEKRP